MTYSLQLPPIQVQNLEQLQEVLEDWRFRLENSVTLAYGDHDTISFAEAHPTASGASRYGIMTTSTGAIGVTVPEGYEAAILRMYGTLTPGASVGPYRVGLIVQELAGASPARERVAGLFSGLTANNPTSIQVHGTWDSPVMTVGAGRTWNVGWKNDTTSPGALLATTQLVAAVYVIRRAL